MTKVNYNNWIVGGGEESILVQRPASINVQCKREFIIVRKLSLEIKRMILGCAHKLLQLSKRMCCVSHKPIKIPNLTISALSTLKNAQFKVNICLAF